jgi:hypothetical protein
MATLQHNITTVLTQDLLKAGDKVSNAKCISIANLDSHHAAVVNLFLNSGDNNYYIIANRRVHTGETLFLNKDNNIIFNNSLSGFSLRIQAQNDSGAAISLDVIITT